MEEETDDVTELKELLARVYMATTHNPEGLNLMDVQNLVRPYRMYFKTDLCKHFFGLSGMLEKCLKCGESRYAK